MNENIINEEEEKRVKALHSLNILDTLQEERFDRITRMALRIFGVPISLVSLVDRDRQWFKSKQGIDDSETPRSMSFCSHAINSDEVFYVHDASKDPSFANNQLVTQAPHIRFYAGSPLKTKSGYRLGTLCLIDSKPREFSEEEAIMLQQLAQMVEEELIDYKFS